MNQKGITLVELIVVMAVAGIIGWVVVSAFTNLNRAVIDQGTVVDVQSTGRNAMATMVRILRETGLDPLGTADAGIEVDSNASKLHITRDANLNGLIDEGTQEDVTFEFTGGRLLRCFDLGSAVENCAEMSDDVQDLTFTYPDGRTMVITLTLREQKSNFTRTLTTTVQGRNP